MKQNIILIGFMGSGKSTVGKELAKILDMKFIDTDNYIETIEKMSIKNIFKIKGEKYFREIEQQHIKEIAKMDHTIIATGGGVASSKLNMELLKTKGFVVYLNCTVNCIYKRVSRRNTRPLLNNVKDLRLRITDLLDQRVDNYIKYMDDEVCINSKTILRDVIEKIKEMYIKHD